MPAGQRLVIVESPAKAKTIAGYLGPGYVVESSIGHIRDLPRSAADVPAEYKGQAWAKDGVDVDNGFKPLYVVSPDKKAQVAKLKAALKESDELYLATDEDREGEAIAWHLLETLKPKIPVHRMVFHEITKSAIEAAVQNPRELDQDLVDAQETRRILDRLYGYRVSEVLWKKVMPRLSAGRVQSVATRVVVERERARMRFRAAGYWDLEATFEKDGEPEKLVATLVQVDGTRLATGRDFDPETGSLTREVLQLDEAGARSLSERLESAAFEVRSVEDKPYTRKPYAPFMTSTLQQEAGRKLRMTAQHAMRTAQRLYENGHITYMRTDSTSLSETAIAAARQQARDLYGPGVRAGLPTQLRQEGEERAGGARGDPPVRRHVQDARRAGPRGQRRRAAALRADLAAHRRLADGRRQGRHGQRPRRCGHGRRHRRRVRRVRQGHHLPRLPAGLRRRQ